LLLISSTILHTGLACRIVFSSSAKAKILDAALRVIRAKGYAATTVDDLCAASDVTKGAFFHHFKSKEDLGVAAVQHWSDVTGELFAAAPYHRHADPLQRVLGYLEFRKQLLTGDVADFTCLVGTMVQETFASSPAIRAACDASISEHAARIETDIAEAIRQHGIRAQWTAKGLALHTQAVLQGAFILAKARDDAKIAAASIDHLRRYIQYLFNPASQKGKGS
jgi:TetR/AcrR family transcriptional regulator, transcriptional repressor for nem operon